VQAYNGGLGRSPQRGSGAELPVGAESLLSIAKEGSKVKDLSDSTGRLTASQNHDQCKPLVNGEWGHPCLDPSLKNNSATGFLPICQNQIQGLFKDFQGPYEGYIRRTKLKQTGTFINISRRSGPLKSS